MNLKPLTAVDYGLLIFLLAIRINLNQLQTLSLD